ncbi:Uncharacterised protein [Mycobacteroides abscessus subsp. abscessus]|nr:Uncharacterised protein [Mycobacteroides abscessus subsp. abscessus]
MRTSREFVLLLTGEFVGGVALLGQQAHGLIGERVMQAVERHVIDKRHVPILEPGAALGQQVGCVGHGFLPTGDHHLELAGPNQLVSKGDGIHTGKAHLVDGERRDVHADPTGNRCLTCGHLPRTGGEHLPHDHVVHCARGHARLRQGARDGDATELGTGKVLQGSLEPANRRTCSSNYYGPICRGHGSPSVTFLIGRRFLERVTVAL